LQIEETGFSDKGHFLYILVPKIIEFKIDGYLKNSDCLPFVTSEIQTRWDDSFNHADELLFASKKNIAQATEIFNDLCDAIAFLAFAPGGVDIFGYRYEVVDGSCET
jgi:hypothetical protein